MRSAKPFNGQTILSINQRHIQTAKTSRSIISINDEYKRFSANPENETEHAARVSPAAANVPSRSIPPEPPSSFSHAEQRPPLSSASAAAPPIADRPVPALRNPLQKGQKASLKSDGKLSRIQARLGWNIKNPQCDTDVSAFLLDNSGKVIGDSWFVFYGQDTSPDGSTRFSVHQGADREIISIDFTKLNPAVSKIVFVLTIHEALEKHLNFSMLKDAYIRIMDETTGGELVSFLMTDYYSSVTSMMIGELYKYNGIWKFNAIGNGVARDLAGLCELYGVQTV